MKKNHWLYFSILNVYLLGSLLPSLSFANRISDPAVPVNHCYHWLNERTNKYLNYKYKFAAANNGELTFYSTPATSNGSVAGPGLYCAKTPIQSYTYGDRVIRIDFVADVVLLYHGKKYCGHSGKFYANQSECDSKPVDIELYNDTNEWYVIKNPQAIASWSANSDKLISDLQNIKADADYGAKAHMDLTLQAMVTDASQYPKQEFQNRNQRMDLVKVLADQKLWIQIPPLSLIAQVYSHPKVTNKNKIYQEQFARALKDTLLTFNDFQDILNKDSEVKSAYLTVLAQQSLAEIKKINIPVVLVSIDKLDAKVGSLSSADGIVKLWSELFESNYNFESLISSGLKDGGLVRKNFDKAVPTIAKLSAQTNLKEENVISMLKVLNAFAASSGSLRAQVSYLMLKLLTLDNSYKAVSIFDGIKNPALDKEKALVDLFSQGLSGHKFKSVDPIAAGVLFDQVSDQVASQPRKDIESLLLAQPLKVTDRLSYALLDDLKNKKLALPSFMSEGQAVLKLIDRSLAERSLGRNTTNSFRMILSGTYDFFVSRVAKKDDKDSKNKNMSMDMISDFYMKMAENLSSNEKSSFYSYIALQNSGLFASELKPKFHPIEKIVEKMDLATDKNIQEIIQSSMDTSVLVFLVELIKASGDLSPKAKILLEGMLVFASSKSFEKTLQNLDFQAAESEKRSWSNLIAKQKEGSPDAEIVTTRVSSSLCAFTAEYIKLDDVIQKIDKNLYDKVNPSLLAIEKSECAKYRHAR